MDNKAFYDEKGLNGTYIPHMNGHDHSCLNGGEKYLYDEKPPLEDKVEKEKTEIEEDDPWKVTSLKQTFTPWEELDSKDKFFRVVGYIVKPILALATLYMFICSLDFLSSAFKLLGGEAAGKVFQQNDIFTNPVAGLMMGVLVTVLVQSSSTSTSIIVSMVGGGLLDIKTSIPMLMGANIGTSVTNTIVAIGQISDKGEFRRAFAGATVHDMFNWLTVIIFLPLEIATGYLYKLSGAIIDQWRDDEEFKKGDDSADADILKVITKPFTEKIIQVNKNAITDIAKGEDPLHDTDHAIMKICCDKTPPISCCQDAVQEMKDADPAYSFLNGVSSDVQKDSVCASEHMMSCVGRAPSDVRLNCSSVPDVWTSVSNVNHTVTVDWLNCHSFNGTQAETQACNTYLTDLVPQTNLVPGSDVNYTAHCTALRSTFTSPTSTFTLPQCVTSWQEANYSYTTREDQLQCATWADNVEAKLCNQECEYLFKGLYPDLNDKEIGGILLVISLAILCTCLVLLVKILHSLLQGPMAVIIKKFVNADFPGAAGYLTGYLAILIGAGLTIVVQSSSIFTSTLTPLVGIGVIEIDRMYPLTLGSNIGTTTTAILSALANSGDKLLDSLQVALCHLFFNISGILIYYPVPFMRFPIPMAKFLGERTANYRWFAILYIIFMFFLLPGCVFALSIPGWYVMAAVLGPVVLVVIIVGVLKVLQAKCYSSLSPSLQDFKCLPIWCRSLKPLDAAMMKLFFCKRFQKQDGDPENQ